MKKIAFVIIIIVVFIIISNSFSSIYTLLSKKNVIIKAQQELIKQQKENSILKRQLNQTQSSQFIEEEARNKLFLVKPGEQIILLPVPKPQNMSKAESTQKKESNWEQWLQVFRF